MIVKEKTHKICAKCKESKPIEAYFIESRAKDGRCYCCKMCQKEKRKNYYQENKDKILSQQNNYYHQNKETLKKKNEEYRKERKLKAPEALMLIRARARAKKQNIPFNITLSDIIIPKICPILKIKLEIQNSPGGSNFSPSLDRKIPELGYIKGNVWVISKLANLMKASATDEQLKLFGQWISDGMQYQ